MQCYVRRHGKMADSLFPVWVGGLAPNITESMLWDLFSKFGPVNNVTILKDDRGQSKMCGFVSFSSYEVSEAAAIALDGCEVFGQIIETKGPGKLKISRQPLVPPKKQAVDRDALLDCVYFVERKKCPLKEHLCRYRHSLEAQATETVCDKWLLDECRNVYCRFRHPLVNVLEDNLTEVKGQLSMSKDAQPRCPSHNAFKCTGECGSDDCDTHFLDMDAMVEHINKAKTSLPSGACSGCKAVFFSQEERMNHVCQEARFIPVYRPKPTSHSSSPLKPSCPCSSSSNITMCVSCGSTYEHSGDSLSTFEHSPDGRVYGGHKCPNSPSVRNTIDNKLEMEPIGVFWDIENCPVPRGKSPVDIVKKIRQEYFANKREVEFMCVCDISKEKKEIIEELNKAQVTVVHINATSKNAADDKLRQSLRRYAQSYPPPATVVLVSGDINFAAELSDLRHRHNLTVICLHNAQAHSALLACAHQAERFDLFTNDLLSVNGQTKEASNANTELSISNLPVGKDVIQIKTRLQKLSDNCGGKVTSVTGRTAVMKFPNYQSAARAKKRLDKEDVFGSLIEVCHTVSKTSITSSPLRTKDKLLPEKVNKLIAGSPEQLVMSVPSLQKEKKKTTGTSVCSGPGSLIRDTLVPQGDKHPLNTTDQLCQNGQFDEDLEEILCHPSHAPSKSISSSTCIATSGAQSLLTYPGSNFAAAMWQHPYYQSLVNLPSQIHTQGIGYPFALPMIGAHQITASWLANLHNFTVLEQQKGGVDIMVRNLDETVSNKELKKKLASVFREHCKVHSVVLHAEESMPLCAFIKVPKLSDAQIAVSKVNNQKIFAKFIMTSIVTEKEKEQYFMSCEVISLLKEAPLKWMPLNKFLSIFYEKCSHPFEMSMLIMLPDLVSIVGKPGSEAICFSTSDLHSIKVILNPSTFATEVYILLKHHKGSILLANFAALYWLKFGKELQVGDIGVCLLDALEIIPNVHVETDSAGKDVVSYSKPGILNGGSLEKLVEISLELQELLKAQPQFKLPLSHLISAYQKWFKRKSPFDPVNYGFSSVKDLLEALPTVVKVQEEGHERYVVLATHLKIKAFEEEVKILLESQPDCCLPLETFMMAYQRCFGRRCRTADYGFDKLVDLVGSISSVARLGGESMNKMVYLVRKDEKKEEFQKTFAIRCDELIKLLSVSKQQQLPVSMVMIKYYEHFGMHFTVGECGFASLEYLLRNIPGVQMNEIGGEKYISLPGSVEKDLVDLVSGRDDGFIPMSQLPSVYQKQFGRRFDLTLETIQDVVKNSSHELQILGVEPDQILCYTEMSEKDQQSHTLKKLAVDLHSLLIRFPGARLSCLALADIFSHQKGYGIKAKKWGCSDLDSLLLALSDSIEVVGSGDFAAVCLKQEYVLRCLARDLVHLLSAQAGKSILVSNLPKAYDKHFGRTLCLEHHGFTQLTDVFTAMSSIIRVLGNGNKRICLAPLQSFAVQAKKLLAHFKGCLSLNRFAPCFQQFYNRPLRAADYGYSRLSEVIAALPHIAELRGKGADKMVILVDSTDVLLPSIGPEVANKKDDGSVLSSSMNGANEGSDTESVMVEEEVNMDHVEDVSCRTNKGKDLIIRNGGEVVRTQDWLIKPAHKTIPEQTNAHYIKDLISFTKFPQLSSAGLEQPGQSSGLLNNHSLQSKTSYLVTPVKMNNALSIHSPTHSVLRQLSDVEAEILNQEEISAGDDVYEEFDKPYKIPRAAKDKSRKMASPLKLAIKFCANK